MDKNNSIKVGILVSGFPPEVLAGAELQAQQTAEQLARRGHQVTVFTRSLGIYPSPVKQKGYTIIPRRVLPLQGLRMLWDIFSTLWDIYRYRPRPDVFLCYEYFIEGLIGVLAQKFMGIPAIVSIRGNLEYQIKRTFKKGVVAPYVFKNARCILVQTPQIKNDMQIHLQEAGKTKLSEAVQEKTLVVPNGIQLPSPQRINGSKVLYIGRLVERKGVADLIAAMKELQPVELVIVGDGPDRNRLEMIADGSPVTFTGRVDRDALDGYLKDARVLVLPSHRGDGLPNVIMEAMSVGVPVVSTKTAGIPDIVHHGQTGFLYEPGDISKLRLYIDRLLSDDELHRQLGENSLKAIQSYSWDIILPQIEEILLECTNCLPERSR